MTLLNIFRIFTLILLKMKSRCHSPGHQTFLKHKLSLSEFPERDTLPIIYKQQLQLIIYEL